MFHAIDRLSISGRILAVAVPSLITLLILAIYSLQAIHAINAQLVSVAEEDIPLTRALTEITSHQLEQAIHFERAIHFGEAMAHKAGAKNDFTNQVNAFKTLTTKVEEEIYSAEQKAEKDLKLSQSEDEEKEFLHVLGALKQIKKEHVDYDKHAIRVFGLLERGELHGVETTAKKVEDQESTLDHELEALLKEIETFTATAAEEAKKLGHRSEIVLIAVSLLALALVSVVAWLVIRSIKGRMVGIAQSLALVSEGNLTEDIQGQDEVAVPMRRMKAQLVEMVTTIGGTASQLSSAAEELSVVTAESAKNLKHQQTETEQTATAINEMNVTARDVSKNISNTAAAAQEANEQTILGQQAMASTMESMRKLTQEVEDMAGTISQVEEDSEAINSIVDVIKNVAEQTNLLALNAAIEAARAGEQGRGFAVVADEVRTLAERTQKSTTEINHMIEKLQQGSRRAVQAMECSQEQVQHVAKQAEMANNSLTETLASISKITEMSVQIASASEEQVAVSDEINKSVVRINDTTTQNATGSNQVAIAGQDLVRIATDLQQLVGQFQIAGINQPQEANPVDRASSSTFPSPSYAVQAS